METHDPTTLRLVPAWDQLLILHFPGHYERGGVGGLWEQAHPFVITYVART